MSNKLLAHIYRMAGFASFALAAAGSLKFRNANW
jgi:hypothetical protein